MRRISKQLKLLMEEKRIISDIERRLTEQERNRLREINIILDKKENMIKIYGVRLLKKHSKLWERLNNPVITKRA